MTDRIFADLMAIATAIIGLAIIATLVSNRASTASVIGAAGKALSDDIKAAVSPLSAA